MLNLTKIRDASVIAGMLAAVAGIAYAVADDLNLTARPNGLEELRKRNERAGRATMPGSNGDLYRVSDDITGQEKSHYVRPATEAEAAASATAGDMFGVGSEVFAVNRAGDVVLPDSPEWSAVLAEAPFSESSRLTYYRVS